MRRLIGLMLLAPAFIAEAKELAVPAVAVTGTFSQARCKSAGYRAEPLPTLVLDSPVFVPEYGLAKELDLGPNEATLMSYGRLLGTHGSIQCSLTTSVACGPDEPRPTCVQGLHRDAP